MDALLMAFARGLAARSTCGRLAVGAVLTDPGRLQVLGIGYNGGARGAPHGCDRPEPGNCGCLHAEVNALLKAPGLVPKILYVTTAPCAACAKAAVNAGVVKVIYDRPYRLIDGLEILRAAGVEVLYYGDTPSEPDPA